MAAGGAVVRIQGKRQPMVCRCVSRPLAMQVADLKNKAVELSSFSGLSFFDKFFEHGNFNQRRIVLFL